MFLNNKLLEFGVFALLFLAGGYLAGATQSLPRSSHHAAKTHNSAHAGIIAVTAAEHATVPSVELNAFKDPAAGWNLQISSQNFRFAPEHAGQDHVLGEGHAHLYVDGTKVARLYGPWFHLGALAPGQHTLKVTLNANDHRHYVVDNRPVSDELIIDPEAQNL